MNLSQVVLVFCVVLIDKGLPLKCFICDSSINPDCENLKTKEIQAEECSPDSILSIQSWLFEINKVQVLQPIPSGVPMICQKIVAKRGSDDFNTTARFCQLDTGETSPCTILKSKIQENYDTISHCSTCNEDNCNSSNLTSLSITLILSSFLLLLKF